MRQCSLVNFTPCNFKDVISISFGSKNCVSHYWNVYRSDSPKLGCPSERKKKWQSVTSKRSHLMILSWKWNLKLGQPHPATLLHFPRSCFSSAVLAFDGNYQQNVDNFSAGLYALQRRVYAPKQDIVKCAKLWCILDINFVEPLIFWKKLFKK